MAQNAQAYSPKKSMRAEIAQAVRDVFNSSSKNKALDMLKSVQNDFVDKAPEFTCWLENNIEEGLCFMSFPREYWKKLRTVNTLERLHREIRRRTRVVKIFPNVESCLRLITAILQEQHEEWGTGNTYLSLRD